MNEPSTSTGLLTATTQVYTRPCRLMGFQLNVAAANGTIVLYDAAAASSDATKVVDKHLQIANNSGVSQWFGPNGVVCNSGLYVTLAGAGAEMIIYYNPL